MALLYGNRNSGVNFTDLLKVNDPNGKDPITGNFELNPTIDFPKLAACGTDMAEVVRGILVTVALISGFRKDAIIKIRP